VKKKFIAAGAALLATAFIGQTVSAKTLEDVLKEKGVITEEDYKSVTKVKPIDYKLGKGFTFTSQDEKFQLSLGGRLQVRYTFFDNDQNAAPGSSDVSQWRVRRMKMWMSGHAYTKDLTYKLQVNFADGGSSKLLEDAYLNYKFLNEAQILAGQDKVPFSRQELTSSGAQEFVDRSNATDTFKPGRDVGVMAHGKFCEGLVEYAAGWYNGEGQSQVNRPSVNSNDNAAAARIEFNPLGYMKKSEADLEYSEKPLVSIGADYYYNSFVRGDTNNNVTFYGTSGWMNQGAKFAANENIPVNTWSADLAFKWLGAFAEAEYYWGQADGDVSNIKQRAQGFYAQAGYFIIPKHLEAAFRYSYVDPDRDVANNNRTETQGAISYYFNQHNLKLQADITGIHQQRVSAAARDDMQYRLQAQIIF